MGPRRSAPLFVLLFSSDLGKRQRLTKSAGSLKTAKLPKAAWMRGRAVVFARAISKAIVLTKRILASSSPRCFDLRGSGYLLEGSIAETSSRNPNPVCPSAMTKDARGQRRRGTVKNRSSKGNEQSFTSWASAHVAWFVESGLGLATCFKLRGSRFRRNKHVLVPPLKGPGRAARGALNQGAFKCLPQKEHDVLQRASRGTRRRHGSPPSVMSKASF
jgi:hypothetical protein